MLGKQITRGRSFSMGHALVLVVALGAASILSPAIQKMDFQVSHASLTVTTEEAGYSLVPATWIKFLECDTVAKDVDV